MAGKSAPRGGASGTPVTIVIRRDEAEEVPHHGGAWKVAYADFVTAMMAFFLLMWLLNATTEEQRTGLADYFAPTNLFGRSVSGSGKPFGGKSPNDDGTSVSSAGAPLIITGRQSPQDDDEDEAETTPAMPVTGLVAAHDNAEEIRPGRGDGGAAASRPDQGSRAVSRGGDYAAASLTPAPTPADPAAAAAAIKGDAKREDRALEHAGAEMLEAIRRDPALQEVAGQLTIDTVPQGLRIQVVDAEHRPMFALGGATPTPRVHDLLRAVVPALSALPNAITIAGHTDALTYRGQDWGNWELSTERANATRRLLLEAGLPDGRIRSVTGNADRDLLIPADPLNPANRRITIIVLRHAGASAPGAPASVSVPSGPVTSGRGKGAP